MTIWPNSKWNKFLLFVLVAAVAFRVAMPAVTEFQCIFNKDALSNACLLAGSMRE